MKRLIARLALLALIPAVVLACEGTYVFGEDSFTIPDTATAKSLEGETVSLADHHGKIIFLVVWRTDCPGCLFELSFLNKLQKEYSNENFTVIGLSIDRGKDKYVARFAKERKIAYPVWLAYGQPIMKYTFTDILPTMFAIGPKGEMLGYHVGAFRNYEEAVAILREARNRAEKAGRTE